MHQEKSKVIDSKIKKGVFSGPQIRELFNNLNFEASLNFAEKAAWNSFKSINENFLGNKRSPNYEEIVGTFLDKYRAIGCDMSLKIQFLHSHLKSFLKILLL